MGTLNWELKPESSAISLQQPTREKNLKRTKNVFHVLKKIQADDCLSIFFLKSDLLTTVFLIISKKIE